MADPAAPTFPDGTPQDVKDFFECKSDKLVWKKGEVTWLKLKDPTGMTDVEVTPEVNFEHGAKGGVQITIKVFGISGTVDASVNANGELAVSSVSTTLSPFKQKIEDAVKNINDWFKKNGKKIKGAKLKGGAVTLEKTAVAVGAGAPASAPVPTPVPAPPEKPKPKEGAGLKTDVVKPVIAPAYVIEKRGQQEQPQGGGLFSMLGLLMILVFFGVIVLGGGIGFVLFGGPGPVALATATPYPTQPGPTPTPEPTATASLTASPSPSPSSSPGATVTASPLPIVGEFSAVCIRVVHEQVGEFISYLDWFVYWSGGNVEYFEVTVVGANNGQPERLEFESSSQAYEGVLGLHEAGDKRIVSVIAHMSDGSEIDLTEDMIDYFGSDTFTVRFPQEDQKGFCPA